VVVSWSCVEGDVVVVSGLEKEGRGTRMVTELEVNLTLRSTETRFFPCQ